jgi:hypothetical protein
MAFSASLLIGRSKMQLRIPCFFVALIQCALAPCSIFCGDQKPSQEEGRFDIYVADKKIGQEKFSIVRSSDSVSSKSTTNFTNPAGQHESVQIETQLKMNSQNMPQAYQASAAIGKRKQLIRGSFIPSQATFEYQTNGIPRKNALLVGDRFVILDTNVFHHFIFFVRLLDFRSGKKPQTVEAVIPQEMDAGIMKVTDVGTEVVLLQGKNRELHHLKADSGPLKIDLWIDEEQVLYKIALPAKRIEVIRH